MVMPFSLKGSGGSARWPRTPRRSAGDCGLWQVWAGELCVRVDGADWCRCASDYERARERRDLLPGEVLDLGDGESGRLDGGERRPVAVAAHQKPVHRVHAVLPAGELGIAGADVLDEEQLPARPQYPAKLA